MNVNPDILKIIEHISTHTLYIPCSLDYLLNTRPHILFARTEYYESGAASLHKFL